MQQVAETLETLLAPGRRFRLSPLVAATQLVVLFGQPPDDRRRAESIRALLEDPASQRVLDEITGAWEAFQGGGKRFGNRDTYQGTFLRSYLAYYTTSNLPKLQAVLTELLRDGSFPLNHFDLVCAFEVRVHPVALELFRGNGDEFVIALLQQPQHAVPLADRHLAVEVGAEVVQSAALADTLLKLVLHQRLERRHHDREAGQQHCRQDKALALAGAGGSDAEH